MATKKSKTASSSRPSGRSELPASWSELPGELVRIISNKLDCFDVVHARSVCSSWHSKFPFPAYLLRKAYSLPSFMDSKGVCIVEKCPLFLFRVRTLPIAALLPCELILGKLRRDELERRMRLVPCPLECSVRRDIPGSAPALNKTRDYQIIPLGDHYRMLRCNWDFYGYKGMAFLQLNKEGEKEEFVVIVSCFDGLMVLKSAEMRWKRLRNVPNYVCTDLVSFRGQFYATFLYGRVVVINPISLVVTPLMPTLGTKNHLIPCGDDELYLVENVLPIYTLFRVSRLDVETGTWVEVNNLGDRIFFINSRNGNVSCLAKELPYGCGLSPNSILVIMDEVNATCYYKFGTRDLLARGWRPSSENRVTILPSSSALALRIVS